VYIAFDSDAKISADMLNKWRATSNLGKLYEPIGFGLQIGDASANQPIALVGNLTAGSIQPKSKGENTLLAILFVVPKRVSSITLSDPQNVKYDLRITGNEFPHQYSSLQEVILSDDSLVSIPLTSQQWCITILRDCKSVTVPQSLGGANASASSAFTVLWVTTTIKNEILQEKYGLMEVCSSMFILADRYVYVPDLLDCRHHFFVATFGESMDPLITSVDETGSPSVVIDEDRFGTRFDAIKFVRYTMRGDRVDPATAQYWGVGEIRLYAVDGEINKYTVHVLLDEAGEWKGDIDLKKALLDFEKPVNQQPQQPLPPASA
jgi:hypothetical protein